MDRIIDAKHNNPPSDVEILIDNLSSRNEEILKKVAQLIEAAARVPAEITDDDQATNCVDYIKLCNTVAKKVDTLRLEETKPFRAKVELVNTFFNANVTALEKCVAAAKKPLDAFTKAKHAAEQKRLAEEAAALKAQSDAEVAAAVSLQKVSAVASDVALDAALDSELQANKYETASKASSGLTAVRSGSGATASLRSVWVGEIDDLANLDLNILRYLIPLDGLQKAVNAYVRQGGRELKGAKIYEKTETTVR